MEKDSIILHINSRDRSENLDINNQYSTSWFKYFFKQPIVNNIGDEFQLSLHSSIIPYSFYNIRTGINDEIGVLIYDPSTGTQINATTLTLTPGSYTAGALITELEIVLSGLKGLGFMNDTISVGFNRQTQKFKFVTVVASDNNKIAFGFFLSTHSAFIETGFRSDETTSKMTNTGTSITSSNVVDVNGSVHSIFIRTSLTSTAQLDSGSGGFTTILGRIPIETNFGSVLFFNPANSTHSVKIHGDTIQNISIKLTDDNNRILDLNGLNFTLSLEFIRIRTNRNPVEIPRYFPPPLMDTSEEDNKTKKKNKKKTKK